MTHTKQDIDFFTAFSKNIADEHMKKTRAFLADSERNKRLNEAFECPTCFYIMNDLVAGQSFVNWNCRKCSTQQTWGNTNHPKLCNDCAKRFQLCRRCGGNVDPKLNYPPMGGDI